jgi:hypothetical protein
MFDSKDVVQDRLEQRAVELRKTADNFPSGDAREALLHKALKMDAAARVIESWISPPGLRPRPNWPSFPDR